MDHPRPLFHLFSVFSNNSANFTTNKCKNDPSIIWCPDSNSRPLDHESDSVTTRPGLRPYAI